MNVLVSSFFWTCQNDHLINNDKKSVQISLSLALNVLRINQTNGACAFLRLLDMPGGLSYKAILDASVRVSPFFRHA